MKKSILFLIFMGLFLLLGCSNIDDKQERSPREELNFFYNVQDSSEKESERAKVYYYGEHYFRE